MSDREVRTRVEVYRGGAYLLTLLATSPPEIVMQREAAIKTSFFGSFRPDDRVNWLGDELRPILVVDGEDHPCGVYLTSTVRERSSETGRVVEVDSYDRCWQVQSCRTETILHLAAGTPYLGAVRDLLLSAGIALMLEVPSTQTLATDREDWPVGTDYLTIINSLLQEINYDELWFDAQGRARLEPVAVPSADSVQHVLDTCQIDSLILSDLTREQDVFNTPNVFVCVCDSPDLDQTLASEAVNDNPQSPLSTIRRGRRIVQVVKVDSTPDQATLDAYAIKLRNDSLRVSETVQIRTALLPGYGVGDVVGLVHPDAQGLYIEAAWRMDFAPGGDMTHVLRRVVLSV